VNKVYDALLRRGVWRLLCSGRKRRAWILKRMPSFYWKVSRCDLFGETCHLHNMRKNMSLDLSFVWLCEQSWIWSSWMHHGCVFCAIIWVQKRARMCYGSGTFLVDASIVFQMWSGYHIARCIMFRALFSERCGNTCWACGQTGWRRLCMLLVWPLSLHLRVGTCEEHDSENRELAAHTSNMTCISLVVCASVVLIKVV
jgi:hypothetical protein